MAEFVIKVELPEQLRRLIDAAVYALESHNGGTVQAPPVESDKPGVWSRVVDGSTPLVPPPAAPPAPPSTGEAPTSHGVIPLMPVPPPPAPAAAPAAPPAAPEPPAAPPEPPTPPALSGELDAAGFPYDTAVHGSGRKFYAASDKQRGGQWKLKRGLTFESPEVIAWQEAKRAEGYGAPATPSADPEPPAAPPAPPAPTSAPPAGATPPPPPPPPPAAPAAQAALTPADVQTFPQLLTYITTEGFDEQQVQAACDSVGLASITLAATCDAALIPRIAAALGL